MRTRPPPFPSCVPRRSPRGFVSFALLVGVAGLSSAGCAHDPPAAPVAGVDSGARERWIEVAPDRRRLLAGIRDERRCRQETPLGSHVARRVCTTRAEDLLQAEAAAEHVRWGTTAAF